MRYLITVLFLFLEFILCYTSLSSDYNKFKFYNILSKENEDSEQVELSSKKRIVISLLITLLGCVCVYHILFGESVDYLNKARLIIPIFCLSGCACFDVRERRIPNLFPAVLLVAGIVLLVVNFVIDRESFFPYFLSSSIATLLCIVVFVFLYIITKHGVGIGDIKLVCALAFISQVYVTCSVLFVGIIICALYSAFLLISKKKKKSAKIAFAPFILIGYYVTMMYPLF